MAIPALAERPAGRLALSALRRPWVAVEIFIIANLAFLAIDVYIAHSVNAFERREEWIPVLFSVAAPLLLIAGAAIGGAVARRIALFTGWVSLAVGVGGMLFHLESHFFEE